MSTSYDVPTGAVGSTKSLRPLYFVRFGFAVVWVLLTLVIAKTITPGAAVLLVLYPLFDVGAAVIDFRSSGTTRARTALSVNMALSLLSAIRLKANAVRAGRVSVGGR